MSGIDSDIAPVLPAIGPRRKLTPALWLLLVAFGIAVVSAVRIWTGADNLDSSGAIQAAITAAVPIALAGLSGLWSERAGVVNIGIEGMMVLGTFGAGYAGYQWGPWAGVFFGIVCGLLGGLLHGLVTITVGVDHIISGVAINILAPGLTLYLSRLVFTDAPGGGQRQSPPVPDVGRITLPWLSDWLGEIEDKGWFFVSDVASILRGSLHQPVAAVRAGRGADRAVRVGAVADQAGPAAAVGRRGALRRRIPRRQRLPVQVHRGDRSPVRWPVWPVRSWWWA